MITASDLPTIRAAMQMSRSEFGRAVGLGGKDWNSLAPVVAKWETGAIPMPKARAERAWEVFREWSLQNAIQTIDDLHMGGEFDFAYFPSEMDYHTLHEGEAPLVRYELWLALYHAFIDAAAESGHIARPWDCTLKKYHAWAEEKKLPNCLESRALFRKAGAHFHPRP